MIRLKHHIRKEGKLQYAHVMLHKMQWFRKIRWFHERFCNNRSCDCTWPSRTIQLLSRPSQHKSTPPGHPGHDHTFCYQTSQTTATVSLLLLRKAAGPSLAYELIWIRCCTASMTKSWHGWVRCVGIFMQEWSVLNTAFPWCERLSFQQCIHAFSPRWLFCSVHKLFWLPSGHWKKKKRVCEQHAVVIRRISLCLYLQILTASAFHPHFPSAEPRTHLCCEKSHLLSWRRAVVVYAARLIFRTSRSAHVSLRLHSLHWLPI